ncbi:bZIP transcription factor domain-containing protein [Purpureocillium lavendulum]|uniref:Mitochondrial distribution and morphology protein 10 n=1 Tax=Purpureocillium lavendulum TaxID=1247861 RepID=A0AB34FT58_9HYPO|nr:bZIP transcription factor domain-containing protein [Purpureocillium lavendulum]
MIFKLLQTNATVSVWLYEQLGIRVEGKIRGFDEFMNLVIDDAVEVGLVTKTNEKEWRKPLGQILLKGDNVSLIQSRHDHRAPEMREFMDYVHSAFYEATGWRRDNTYAALNATSDALLDFPTPRGLRLTLSSLASPNFATSYQLGSVGVVDGSISYLFSSVPLRVLLTPQSESVPLPELLRSYRPLSPLPRSPEPVLRTPLDAVAPQPSLLYGRLYLPQSQLEALVVRRISPALQLQFSAVSAQHLRDGGTALGLAQYDTGRYALEGLASSDGGLLGFRGIYNFGGDAEVSAPASGAEAGGGNGGDRERIYGRFSTGGEIYYGTLNKSGGVSLGARFATLPAHKGTPLCATLTLNPLMGNIAATYAVVAGKHCSLATRMEFNIFSYESGWAVGMELWRKPFRRPVVDNDEVKLPTRSFQAKLEWRVDEPPVLTVPEPEPKPTPAKRPSRPTAGQGRGAGGAPGGGSGADEEDEYAGVLKTRLDQNLRIGVLWEGRVKSLLFSLGSGIDLRKLDKPFRTLGLEIQFSS